MIEAAALIGDRVEPDLLRAVTGGRHRCPRRADRRRAAGRRRDGAAVPPRDRPAGRRAGGRPAPRGRGARDRILARLEAAGVDGRRPPGPPRRGCARRGRGRHATPAGRATGPRGWPRGARPSRSTSARCASRPPTSRCCGPSSSTGSATSRPRSTMVGGDRVPRGVDRAVARRGGAGPRGRRPPAAELRPVAYLPRTRGPGGRRRRPRRPRAARHVARAGVGPGHLGEQRDAARGLRDGHGPTGTRALDLAEQLGLDDVRSDALNTLAVVAAWTGRRVVPDAARVPDGGPADGPPHAGRACLHQPRGHPDRPGALPRGGALLPRGRRVLPGARPDDVGAVPGRGAGLDPPPRRRLAGPGGHRRRAPRRRPRVPDQPDHVPGAARDRAGTARAARVERAARGGSRVGRGPRRARVGGAHHVRPGRGALAARRRRRRPRGPRRRAPRSPRPAPASGRWPRC